MATPSVLTNCKLYLAQYDLSGYSNKLEITDEVDEVEVTTFGNAAHNYLPGLAKIAFSHEGFFTNESAAPLTGSDDAISAKLSTQSVPMMVCPTTGALATPAFFAPQMSAKYTWGGQIGEANMFTVSGVGQGYRLVRGQIMVTGSKTATANGTAYQLGAVTAATNYLYAQLHVFSVSGTNPTLDVVLASDDAESFLSGTSRITFTQATAATSQWATPVAGPITDTWWRIQYTIAGTDTPTFNFAVAVGIR